MPATTTKAPRVAKPRHEETLLEALQHTVDDLDSVRDRLRERVGKDAGELQASLVSAGDDLLREIAVRAVRLMHDTHALTAVSTAVRDRRAELRAS